MLSFQEFIVEKTGPADTLYHVTFHGGYDHVTALNKHHNKGLEHDPNPKLQYPAGYSSKNAIGYAQVWDGRKRPQASSVEVHPDWRRKGVATAMYDKSNAVTGKKLTGGDDQTSDAEKFWKFYDKHSRN